LIKDEFRESYLKPRGTELHYRTPIDPDTDEEMTKEMKLESESILLDSKVPSRLVFHRILQFMENKSKRLQTTVDCLVNLKDGMKEFVKGNVLPRKNFYKKCWSKGW